MTEALTLQGSAAQEAVKKTSPGRRHQALFHRALIAEGMRRTRTLALLMGVLVWGAAILVPIIRYGEPVQSVPILCGPIQLNPLLLFSFSVFAPFLTLKAFDFLNSRSGSDLFHAFPVRRQTLAASFLLAVALWLCVIIGCSILLTGISCAFLKDKILLDVTHLRTYLLQLLAGSFLVEMSMFLAMTLTGTFLTNIVTALGLIFLPRFLIFAGAEMLTEIVPMLSSNHLPLFFTNRLNFVTGMVFGVFGGSIEYSNGAGGPLYFAPSILYTCILALFYAAAGILIFVRRPSETAGRPTLGRAMQSATRIGIGFLFTVPALVQFCFTLFRSSVSADQSERAAILGLYLLSIGAMFAYEYLSAHRLLPFGELLKGMAVVLLLNALWIAGGFLGERIYSGERIRADEIEYISLSGSWNLSSILGDDGAYGESYFGEKLSGIPLQGDPVCTLAATRHNEAAQKIDPYESVTILETESTSEEAQEQAGESFWVTRVEARLHLKNGRDLYRNLVFTPSDLQLMWEQALPSISESLVQLPGRNELQYLNMMEDIGATGIELWDLYGIYQEELSQQTGEEWFQILMDPNSFQQDVMCIETREDSGNWMYASLPITDRFPRTQKALQKLIENGAGHPAETETEEMSGT